MRRKLILTAWILCFGLICRAEAQVSDTTLDGLVSLIVQAESSGNPWAVGPAGERGLCQITESTWYEYSDYPYREAFDPMKNIQVCRAILEDINEHYGERATVQRITYTYNTGKYCFEKHLPRWVLKHKNKIYRSIFKAKES